MNDQAYRLRRLVQDKQNDYQQGISPVHAAQEDDIRTPKARIIAITSGKGGVGKTNLTVNMAIALSMMGKRVLIIDADLGMANVDVILGTSSKYSLLNLVQENITVADVIAEGPCGVKYLSGGSGIEKLANFNYHELNQITKKLYECEAFADIILLDTGAGLGKNVLNFLIAADEVILVTTPEPTAMTDAYAIMKAYSVYANSPSMKLVVNRVFDDEEGSEVIVKLAKTAERFLQLRIIPLGEIYEDRNMVRAVKSQIPLIIAYPGAVSARCIKAIAANFLDGSNIEVSRGLKGFLERFMAFLR